MSTVTPLRAAAVLMCQKCKHPLPHAFVKAQKTGGGTVGATEEIFGCKGCGTERRYGLYA